MAERSDRAIVFRLNDHGQGPELLRQVFLERGWLEFEEDEQEEHEWNLWWRSSRFRMSEHENVLPWQRLNHHPKSQAITKKDFLARNMKLMRGVHGPKVYNFSPLAFNLPNDYTRFVAEYARLKEKCANKDLYWICKPADLSRGRGIMIFKDIAELQYDCSAVVQQYLMNPLLISGYKFDLRIYVVVPSFSPMHIFIYEEGLVRFSTEKYDLNCLSNLYSHLTNTSINKYSPSYTTDKERVGPGCKWTLAQLRHYFHQVNIDDQALWPKIINIVMLTILIQALQAQKACNCVELFGFDILIDDNLKPWLLEVNFGPALSSDCQVDVSVKKPMLHDLLDMLGFVEADKMRGSQNIKPGKCGNGDRGVVPSGTRRSRMAAMSRMHAVGKLPSILRSSGRPLCSSSTYSSLAADEGDSSDCEVMPIIPGCGLPSVQQSARHSINSTSGHSSASSSSYSTDNRYGNKPWVGSTKGLPGSASSKTHRASHKKGVKGAVKQTKRYPRHMDSKVSIYSDSAVSSCSGSSDNSGSNLNAANGNTVRVTNATLALAPSLRPRTNRRRYCSAVGSSPPDEGIDVRSAPSQEDAASLPKYAQSHAGSVSANVTATKSTPLTRSHSTSTCFGANSHLVHSQPHHGTNVPSAAFAKQPQGMNIGQLQDRYGGLVRVFPFNEASTRCSQNPDAKAVIQECQKWLRTMVAQAKASDQGKRPGAGVIPLWRPLKTQ